MKRKKKLKKIKAGENKSSGVSKSLFIDSIQYSSS
jgi:hypothetical protein